MVFQDALSVGQAVFGESPFVAFSVLGIKKILVISIRPLSPEPSAGEPAQGQWRKRGTMRGQARCRMKPTFPTRSKGVQMERGARRQRSALPAMVKLVHMPLQRFAKDPTRTLR
jgi:hypothetical protein